MSVVAKAGTLSLVPSFDTNAKKGEPGYIENRTHCKDYTSWVPWIKEITHTAKAQTTSSGSVVFTTTFSLDHGTDIIGDKTFEIGETYKVEYDGETYYCEAFCAVEGNTSRALSIGNSELAHSNRYTGGDVTLPFLFMDINGTGATWQFYTDTEGEHVISVSRVLYRTIDPNFIGDKQRADKLSTFDLSIMHVDGTLKTYRMYGYEVEEQ